MNTVFCFGATSHPSHNKNRKVFIMRLLKVFLGEVQKASVLFLRRRARGIRPSVHVYVRECESVAQHTQKLNRCFLSGNLSSPQKEGFPHIYSPSY